MLELNSRSDTLTQLALSHQISSSKAWLAIIASISLIAAGDYLTGIHISLLFFYLLPIALAVAWRGWRSAILVACVIVIVRVTGDWIGSNKEWLPDWYFWNALTSLVVFFSAIWLLDAFLSLQRMLEKRVIDRTAALIESARVRRRLEEELLAVATRERSALGHELHDEICQHLVGTALAAQVLVRRLGEQNSEWVAEARAVVSLVEEGAEKTRKLAHGLLLTEVEPATLEQKLIDLADDTRQHGDASGISCHFFTVGDIQIVDSGVATQLLRITQEALRNALKHSRATRIDIQLTGDDNSIALSVRDNGRGISRPPTASAGMGLRVMANRAAFIGATFSVLAQAEGGTEMLCRLPRYDSASLTPDQMEKSQA